MLLLAGLYEHAQCCFYALEERGRRAEQVADEAVDQLDAFAAGDGAVDPSLADQLILPLALAGGESRLRTSRITAHLVTNAEVVRRFLPVGIEVAGEEGAAGVVRIAGTSFS